MVKINEGSQPVGGDKTGIAGHKKGAEIPVVEFEGVEINCNYLRSDGGGGCDFGFNLGAVIGAKEKLNKFGGSKLAGAEADASQQSGKMITLRRESQGGAGQDFGLGFGRSWGLFIDRNQGFEIRGDTKLQRREGNGHVELFVQDVALADDGFNKVAIFGKLVM